MQHISQRIPELYGDALALTRGPKKIILDNLAASDDLLTYEKSHGLTDEMLEVFLRISDDKDLILADAGYYTEFDEKQRQHQRQVSEVLKNKIKNLNAKQRQAIGNVYFAIPSVHQNFLKQVVQTLSQHGLSEDAIAGIDAYLSTFDHYVEIFQTLIKEHSPELVASCKVSLEQLSQLTKNLTNLRGLSENGVEGIEDYLRIFDSCAKSLQPVINGHIDLPELVASCKVSLEQLGQLTNNLTNLKEEIKLFLEKNGNGANAVVFNRSELLTLECTHSSCIEESRYIVFKYVEYCILHPCELPALYFELLDKISKLQEQKRSAETTQSMLSTKGVTDISEFDSSVANYARCLDALQYARGWLEEIVLEKSEIYIPSDKEREQLVEDPGDGKKVKLIDDPNILYAKAVMIFMREPVVTPELERDLNIFVKTEIHGEWNLHEKREIIRNKIHALILLYEGTLKADLAQGNMYAHYDLLNSFAEKAFELSKQAHELFNQASKTLKERSLRVI